MLGEKENLKRDILKSLIKFYDTLNIEPPFLIQFIDSVLETKQYMLIYDIIRWAPERAPLNTAFFIKIYTH